MCHLQTVLFLDFCNLLFTDRRVNRNSRWSVQNLLRLSCPEIGADDGALLDTSNATTPVSRRTAVDDGVVAVTWMPLVKRRKCLNSVLTAYSREIQNHHDKSRIVSRFFKYWIISVLRSKTRSSAMFHRFMPRSWEKGRNTFALVCDFSNTGVSDTQWRTLYWIQGLLYNGFLGKIITNY